MRARRIIRFITAATVAAGLAAGGALPAAADSAPSYNPNGGVPAPSFGYVPPPSYSAPPSPTPTPALGGLTQLYGPGLGLGGVTETTTGDTASLSQTPTVAQPAACQFILGFKTLHDLDPADVGDCTDNQGFAPNGDAQQHTTKGLMAWRKADNWTAFTNGYMTWINGPAGLVSRLNTQRCSFEGDAASFPHASCGGAAAQPAPPAPAQQAPASSTSSCDASIAGAYGLKTSAGYSGVIEHVIPATVLTPMDILTLGSDCTWALGGGASGTWSTAPIQPADSQAWGGVPSGSTTKIVFSGWPGAAGSAQGPLGTAYGVPFLWSNYDSGGAYGQVFLHYDFNSNPCGPSNSACNGSGSLAQTMMRIEAAQNGIPSL